MAITTDDFETLVARKNWQVDQILGRDEPRPQGSDTYAEKLQSHNAAVARAAEKTQVNLPERGPRPPAPVQPADPLDTNVILGDVSYSLFFLVRSLAVSVGPERLVAALVAAMGPETVLAALRDLGHVREFSE